MNRPAEVHCMATLASVARGAGPVFLVLLVSTCSSSPSGSLPGGENGSPDASAGVDGSALGMGGADGSLAATAETLDAAGDGSALDATAEALDAGGDGSVPAIDAGGYHDVGDPSLWSSFDVGAFDAGANGFVGAAFDGRYMYFPPSYGNTLLARLDTQASFTSTSSWTFFDMSTLNSNLFGALGAVFDGRYMYVVGGNALAGDDDLVVRLDTQASFADPTAWTVLDLTTIHDVNYSFTSGVFDGRYVYFVPYDSPTLARYDTLSDFTAASSWTFTTQAGGDYMGGVFDGRYVYFVPWDSNLPGQDTERYDTTGEFVDSDAGAWSSGIDIATININTVGFQGGAFDGRYFYMAPYGNQLSSDGIVPRFDTTAQFSSAGSWATFDATQVNPNAQNFFGAAFDGRYVYFVPQSPGLVVTRYDTLGSFGSVSSWSVFDPSTLQPASNGFEGAAFDGQYVYFVPWLDGVFVRFDAKSAAGLPPLPAFHGSFF